MWGGPHTAEMPRRVGMSSPTEGTTARGGGSGGGGGTAKAPTAACRVPAGWQRRHSGGRPLHSRHPPVRRSRSLATHGRRVHHDGSAAPRRRRARRQPQERPAAPLPVSGQPLGCEAAARAATFGCVTAAAPRGRASSGPHNPGQRHHCRHAGARHAAPAPRPSPLPPPPAVRRLPPDPRQHRPRRTTTADPRPAVGHGGGQCQ